MQTATQQGSLEKRSSSGVGEAACRLSALNPGTLPNVELVFLFRATTDGFGIPGAIPL